MEHPEEKEQRSKEYQEYAKQYSIDNCVSQLEEVFQLSINEMNAKKNK